MEDIIVITETGELADLSLVLIMVVLMVKELMSVL